MEPTESTTANPQAWHVLVCGLPLVGDAFELGESISLRRLVNPLTVFNLADGGADGFREWAALEPLSSVATAELVSPLSAAKSPGYDALSKCWLVSALLVIRGFAKHYCPAVSAYSWNLIAGISVRLQPAFTRNLPGKVSKRQCLSLEGHFRNSVEGCSTTTE